MPPLPSMLQRALTFRSPSEVLFNCDTLSSDKGERGRDCGSNGLGVRPEVGLGVERVPRARDDTNVHCPSNQSHPASHNSERLYLPTPSKPLAT
jgi:hypothetical protein